jgi:hypothetical protein
MPAKSWVVPGSLADQITSVLAAHPGGLRTAELSQQVYPDPAAAGYPSRSKATMAVGNECKRLFNTNRLARTQQRVPGRVRPLTRYLIPPDPTT